MRFFKLTSTALGAGMLLTACSADVAETAPQADFEAKVAAVIIDNPEIIEKALIKLQKERRANKLLETKRAIDENSEQIYADPRDFSIGPPEASVTVVEFFDYRCSACRYSADWTASLPQKYDNNVRVVFKEFPILSDSSVEAAKAALAAGKVGAYIDMHTALMLNESDMSQEDLEKVATDLEIDISKFTSLMQSEDLGSHIADNQALAQAIGADSTPTFIINDTLFVGADLEAMDSHLDALLRPAN